MATARTISQEDLHTILAEADGAARRLLRRLRLPRADLDDLRQELLSEIVARLDRFDRTRGALGAFAGIVATSRASRIAARVRRHRRLFGCEPIPFDAAVAGGEGTSPGSLLGEAAVQWMTPFAQIEKRIDIERALALAGAGGRRLAAGLFTATAHELAVTGHGSRSEVYRQARALRLAFMAAGIAGAA